MLKESIIKRLDSEESVDEITTRLNDSLDCEVALNEEEKNQTKEIEKLFSSGAIMYLNPTEIAPINDIAVPGDDFLTVLSSGDFLIDLAFHGAHRVLSFDINKNQYYVAQLKLKALQNINYRDYEDFFSEPFKDTFLSDKIYNKIKDGSLDDNLYTFWDLLIERVREDREIMNEELLSLGLPINRDELLNKLYDYGYYYRDGISERTLNYILYELDEDYDYITVFNHIMGLKGYKSIDSYRRSEKDYNKARNKVGRSEFDFIESDLALVKSKLDESLYTTSSDYDRFRGIYLSNIPEYLEGEEFFRIVDDDLIPLLKEDGVICYCCQGMNPYRLCMSEDRLNFYKNALESPKLVKEDFLMIRKVINNVEAYKRLREKYKLEFVVDSALDPHGFDLEDTFVYVKKK